MGALVSSSRFFLTEALLGVTWITGLLTELKFTMSGNSY